jgi:hypothetical protein
MPKALSPAEVRLWECGRPSGQDMRVGMGWEALYPVSRGERHVAPL